MPRDPAFQRERSLVCVLGMRGIKTPPIFGLTSEEVRARSVTQLTNSE